MFSSVDQPTNERLTSRFSSYNPSHVPVSSLQMFHVVSIEVKVGAKSVRKMFAVGTARCMYSPSAHRIGTAIVYLCDVQWIESYTSIVIV